MFASSVVSVGGLGSVRREQSGVPEPLEGCGCAGGKVDGPQVCLTKMIVVCVSYFFPLLFNKHFNVLSICR